MREHKNELFAKWNEVKVDLDDAWVNYKVERESKQRNFLAVLEEKLDKK